MADENDPIEPKPSSASTAADADHEKTPKRSKSSTLLSEVLHEGVVERTEEIKKVYNEATPYRHAQVKNLFQPDFVNKVKEEVTSHTKVNFKESDLFRVYQSIDLANLKEGTMLADHLPSVMKLKELLYSQEWRSLVEQWANLPPSTLIPKIDCAFNCHAPGCHLLCHDDVIGTRKVSYIIYLTDHDWQKEEGGSLELYGPQCVGSDPSVKSSVASPLPLQRVWPTFNSVAFFVVKPGESFHAVQEVVGNRPRLSLQGWYHAAAPPDNMEQATLQQLKALTSTPEGQEGGEQRVKLLESDESEEFTEEDRKFLLQYLHDEYLTDKSMADIAKQFEEESSVQLRNFFLEKWVPKLEARKLSPYTNEYYNTGISNDWKIQGPAHMQRYLEYKPNEKGSGESQIVGSLLHHVRTNVLESKQLARFFKRITTLHCEHVQSSKIRRFRPGLDYTVAHYGLVASQPFLDATVCFVEDFDDEDRRAWESGDVGGFECYIAADDEEEDEKDESGPADEYDEDDNTQLLSVSPSNNTLNLVFRDPGTLRFVKYVSHSAPSSRYDICIEYQVADDGDDDDNDADAEEGGDVDETTEETGDNV